MQTVLDATRANPFLVIKGGVLDGKVLTSADVVKLADLESREVLLAKLAGAMKASLAGAAATFAALPAQMARLLAALEEQRAGEAPDGAAGPGAATEPGDAAEPDGAAGQEG